MNQRAEDALIEKLRQLTPERLAQVADFIDFLAAQERRREAIARLKELHEKLPAEEITEAEMQGVVDAVREVRAERRAKREQASRTE